MKSLDAHSEPVAFTRIAALGSFHHGDDLAWQCLAAIEAESPALANCAWRSCRNPIDLLHGLEHCTRLIVIDTFNNTNVSADLVRMVYPADLQLFVQQSSQVSNHGLTLSQVLQLAESLSLLPQQVVVIGLNLYCADHARLQRVLRACLAELAAENAGRVPGQVAAERGGNA